MRSELKYCLWPRSAKNKHGVTGRSTGGPVTPARNFGSVFDFYRQKEHGVTGRSTGGPVTPARNFGCDVDFYRQK